MLLLQCTICYYPNFDNEIETRFRRDERHHLLDKTLAAVSLLRTRHRYIYVDEPLLYDNFPSDFMWAAATSAYQIEGGWDADGKLENVFV